MCGGGEAAAVCYVTPIYTVQCIVCVFVCSCVCVCVCLCVCVYVCVHSTHPSTGVEH